MTKDLLLHIGAHKTGTTSIQDGLARNREVLTARGVTFASFGSVTTIHPALQLPTPSRHLIPQGMVISDLDALVDTLANAPTDRVIASGENLSFLFDPGQIIRLKTALGRAFDSVRIVTYLRRQDRHAVSHHQEGAKPDRKAEVDLFGTAPRALPQPTEEMRLYLDFNRRIGHWMDAFGDANVTVRIFEPSRLIAGDAWLDFLSVAGISAEGLQPVARQNVGLGATKTKIGHIAKIVDLPNPLHARLLAALPDDARMRPSRAEAKAFFAPYRDGNMALARRLGEAAGQLDGTGLFDDDFSSYPEDAEDSWSEDSANAAIASVLKFLAQSPMLPNASHLREAAELALAAGKPHLAMRLVMGAVSLRPNAPQVLALKDKVSRRLEVIQKQEAAPL